MKTLRENIQDILGRGHEFEPSDAREICQVCGVFEDDHEVDKAKAILQAVLTALPEKKKPTVKITKGELSYYEESPKEYGWNSCLDTIKERLEKI